MRTEVKFAVVVVLVAVIGAAVYFFRREGDQPIALTSAKPPAGALGPKVEELPLPLGPSRSVAAEEPAVTAQTPTVQPAPDMSAETPRAGDRAKPLVTIDLNPVTVEPSETRASRPTATPKEEVFANTPTAIDIDAADDNATRPSADVSPTAATIHVVKADDTMYQIAREHYGRPEMWTVIARANQEVNPNRLRVGQKLTIPPLGKAKSTFDGPAPGAADESDAAESTSARTGKGRPYKVQPGDTLHSIARTQLGAGSRWREIKELNKTLIGKPGSLRVGQTIYLPETKPNKTKATTVSARNAKSAKAAKSRKARATPTPAAVEEPMVDSVDSEQ